MVYTQRIPLLSFVLIFSPPADAQDASRGAEIARQWCSACHLVAASQLPAPTVAPTFSSIARRPGFDVNVLQSSLLAPHPRMPERGLSREEAADLTAYIRSLR
jgi:mono/diheme cytochrome c family protein